MYVLSADSGETRWVFGTGDAVKSRPAADPLTGRMMVGSHDGFVYALDLQVSWGHVTKEGVTNRAQLGKKTTTKQ